MDFLDNLIQTVEAEDAQVPEVPEEITPPGPTYYRGQKKRRENGGVQKGVTTSGGQNGITTGQSGSGPQKGTTSEHSKGTTTSVMPPVRRQNAFWPRLPPVHSSALYALSKTAASKRKRHLQKNDKGEVLCDDCLQEEKLKEKTEEVEKKEEEEGEVPKKKEKGDPDVSDDDCIPLVCIYLTVPKV